MQIQILIWKIRIENSQLIMTKNLEIQKLWILEILNLIFWVICISVQLYETKTVLMIF